MYTVLWIDDELASLQSEMNIYAKKYRCKLAAFETRDEGMKYFRKHFREIDAIILDGLFVVNSIEDEDIKEKALNLCLEEITRIEERENTYFPRVIYTGQQKILGDQDFEENRGIKVFEKVDDPIDLFKYVKDQIDSRQQSYLRKLYSNFADVCNSPIFDGADLWIKFLPALEAINQNQLGNTAEKVGALRRVLDRLSKSMSDYGMIPEELTDGTASLTLVSLFLAGKPANLRRDNLIYQIKSPIFPSLFLNAFRFILDATGVASHEEWKKDDSLKDHSIVDYEKIIPNNHLLQTATFVTMDLVIGIHNYISKNPNASVNVNNWNLMKPASGGISTGVICNVIQSGAAFFKPDGASHSSENCFVPKGLVKEYNLTEGTKIEAEISEDPKGPKVTSIIATS